MNKYLEIELTPNLLGGGSFYCSASFRLDNIKTSFQDIEVKIDTGCSISTIPAKKLNVSDILCRTLKSKDIDNEITSVRSYGIETGGQFHRKPRTKRQKMKCSALKFKHSVTDFLLDGVNIPTQSIFLNYDRSGNILIGMDILQKMICHSDISKKTGKLTLLCCPREAADEEFYRAMKEHFGLSQIK